MYSIKKENIIFDLPRTFLKKIAKVNSQQENLS